MLTNDELILPLLGKDVHMWDKEHMDVKGGSPSWALMGGEYQVADVTNQREKLLTYLVMVKGLVEANYMGWE
jgi:hypothetical protein